MTAADGIDLVGRIDCLQPILSEAARRGASDLHLSAGAVPTARVDGDLVALPFAVLSNADTDALCLGLLSPEQRTAVETAGGVDFSFNLPAGGRCRAHVFRQRDSFAAAFRILAGTLPNPAEPLGVHPSEPPGASWSEHVAALRRGLVLITGATGSGKSTTLAVLLDRINRERPVHIVTIEDPIEHVHAPRRALITQRQLHSDTPSFADALRSVLRQDPDVVLIGEIRDRETMEAALTVAETGHLVLSSLHTGAAAQAVQRVLDLFPPQDQPPIRAQLAAVLEVIVCQQLLPRADGGGRIVAAEVLRVTAAIRNLIREGKTHQLDNMMQLGQTQSGTRTMLQALAALEERGLITHEHALKYSHDADTLRSMMAPAGNERRSRASRQDE